MDIYEWNEFLWEIIETRLYDPGRKLYLSFDDSLLKEEFQKNGTTYDAAEATEALNALIARHCQKLQSGMVGLSKEPDGKARRNNWRWVFEKDEAGLSLALVFAVHQILAAERMRSVSYYTAYWQMLGFTSDEVRKNPFGDGGKISFNRLWMQQLREELKAVLGVKESEITFSLGHRSNKYRNLPVSQSLLSENDLITARSSITRPDGMTDAGLYAALRRARLSKAGRRKVFIAAIQKDIVHQFRDYVSKNAEASRDRAEPSKKKTAKKENVPQLAVYEEYEFFGDSIFHVIALNSDKLVAPIIEAYLQKKKCLVFGEQPAGIYSIDSQVLTSQEGQIFILTKEEELPRLLREHSESPRVPSLRTSFSQVESSLPTRFSLLRCLSLPDDLVGMDLSRPELGYAKGIFQTKKKVQLLGGICLNKQSYSYVLGYGPSALIVNGVEIDREENCELDAEKMSLRLALDRLSISSTPCRFELRIFGINVYVDMAAPRNVELKPAYVRTDRCILPIAALEAAPEEYSGNATFLSSSTHVCLDDWPAVRKKRFARLAALTFRRDTRWIKVDARSSRRCLALLSYFDLPYQSKHLVASKIIRTMAVPWVLYAEASQSSERMASKMTV